jgi:hypothetical protein
MAIAAVAAPRVATVPMTAASVAATSVAAVPYFRGSGTLSDSNDVTDTNCVCLYKGNEVTDTTYFASVTVTYFTQCPHNDAHLLQV